MGKQAGYTSPQALSYPQYVSLDREGPLVRVIVRSPAQDDGSCGEAGVATIPFEELKRMVTSLDE